MNKTTISRHIGEMATLALLFFSNAAFADDSENRLNAYKGNKLIPQEVNAQYDSMKADLPSKKLVYVDGVMTRIP